MRLFDYVQLYFAYYGRYDFSGRTDYWPHTVAPDTSTPTARSYEHLVCRPNEWCTLQVDTEANSGESAVIVIAGEQCVCDSYQECAHEQHVQGMCREPCALHSCPAGQTCLMDNEGGYVCVVNRADGEVPHCGGRGANLQCGDGGVCVLTPPQAHRDWRHPYVCICKQGMTGRTCQIDVNECATEPCEFGGKCTQSSVGGFKCTCAAGYEGERCTEDKKLKKHYERVCKICMCQSLLTASAHNVYYPLDLTGVQATVIESVTKWCEYQWNTHWKNINCNTLATHAHCPTDGTVVNGIDADVDVL